MTETMLREALRMLNDLCMVSASSTYMRTIEFDFDGTSLIFWNTDGEWVLHV